jgi:hypothetical protein
MNHTILAVSICSVCGGGGGFIQLKRRQFTSGTRLTITQKKEHYAHTKEICFFIFILLFLCV